MRTWSKPVFQEKWIWPPLIVASGVLAGSLSLTNSAIFMRPIASIWFLLVCPGMALVRLLPIKDRLTRWILAVALSLAVDTLVASILVYAHLWSPNAALVILIATSLVGVSVQVAPERWHAITKPFSRSLPADGGLWYRKVIKSGSYLITNLSRAVKPARPFASEQTSLMGLTRTHRKILLVDRDETYSVTVSDYMKAFGYEMFGTKNGDEALHVINKAKPDLILLDIGLSGLSGWDTLQRLCEKSSAPIIMLMSKPQAEDILHSFQSGADDFMTKSTSYSKLEAMVSANLSRSRVLQWTEETVKSGELTINFVQKVVNVNNQQINLTPLEYRLLYTLARQANRTIPIIRLLTEVWGSSQEGSRQNLRKHIQFLRKKIETDPGQPVHIITRRGYGYRFE